jgi:hypothetical protein
MYSSFHENLIIRPGSGFPQNRSRTGAGTGATRAAEDGKPDAEDAAAAVADADLDLRAAIEPRDGEALPDERFVERVGRVAPSLA